MVEHHAEIVVEVSREQEYETSNETRIFRNMTRSSIEVYDVKRDRTIRPRTIRPKWSPEG